MTAFLGVLIWIGIIIVLILGVRSIILKIMEKRQEKKSSNNDIKNDDRKE